MEISEVRVKLVGDSEDRLKAYCSITIDECFVIRDLKVIDGTNGLFVAMPSRKLAAKCPSCGAKNHLRARYCSECGAKVNDKRPSPRWTQRDKLHADIAHPINSECRQFVQSRVIEAYEAEVKRAQAPDYRGSGYDEGYDDEASPYEEVVRELKSDVPQTQPAPTEATEVKPPPSPEDEPDRRSTEVSDGGSSAQPGENEFGAGIL